MSGDLEQEYFSDGIADDIITELSRSRSLFVIAQFQLHLQGPGDRRDGVGRDYSGGKQMLVRLVGLGVILGANSAAYPDDPCNGVAMPRLERGLQAEDRGPVRRSHPPALQAVRTRQPN
jgi:hypothetical protein